MPDWTSFLSAMTLALVRVSGMVAFAPFFSSTALPLRAKAVFAGAVAFLLAPLVAALPSAQVSLGFSALAGRAGRGAGLRPYAHAAERDAALCRPDRRPAVQLLAGQPAGPRLGDPDAAAGRPVSTDGHAGGDYRRPGPDSAGLDGAQLSRGAAGQLRSGARHARWRSCAPPEASFWPLSSWPRRCWRQPCWSRWPWLCWASSARSCR